MTIKICKQCNIEKNNFSLSFNKDKSKSWEISICKDCQKINRKIYSKNNRIKLNKKMSDYRKNNPDKIAQHKKKYYLSNKEKIILAVKKYIKNNLDKVNIYYKNYRIENLERISKRMKDYISLNKEILALKQKEKYNSNPSIRIRKVFSSRIRNLLINNGSKKTSSILKHLPYSIDDLRIRLESLFEPWMTWNNYGIYKKSKWNDDDQSTWTWQIDHIIPNSRFKYYSMEDDAFKKCWSLDNLRPYSSKQNLLDSNRKLELDENE